MLELLRRQCRITFLIDDLQSISFWAEYAISWCHSTDSTAFGFAWYISQSNVGGRPFPNWLKVENWICYVSILDGMHVIGYQLHRWKTWITEFNVNMACTSNEQCNQNELLLGRWQCCLRPAPWPKGSLFFFIFVCFPQLPSYLVVFWNLIATQQTFGWSSIIVCMRKNSLIFTHSYVTMRIQVPTFCRALWRCDWGAVDEHTNNRNSRS